VRRISLAIVVLGMLAALSIATVAIAADGGGSAPDQTPAADPTPAADVVCSNGEVPVQEILSYAAQAPGYETEQEAFDAYAADATASVPPSAEVTMVSDGQGVVGGGDSEIRLDLETTPSGGFLVRGATYCSQIADEAVVEGGA